MGYYVSTLFSIYIVRSSCFAVHAHVFVPSWSTHDRYSLGNPFGPEGIQGIANAVRCISYTALCSDQSSVWIVWFLRNVTKELVRESKLSSNDRWCFSRKFNRIRHHHNDNDRFDGSAYPCAITIDSRAENASDARRPRDQCRVRRLALG